MKKKELRKQIKELKYELANEKDKYKYALYDDNQLSRELQRTIYEKKEEMDKLFLKAFINSPTAKKCNPNKFNVKCHHQY